jgi:hypothetical protein
MPGVADLIAKFDELKDDVTSFNLHDAWKHEIELQQIAYDIAFPVGFQAVACTPDDRAAIVAKCAELERCCNEKLAHPPVAAGPVGKIGDGKILNVILKLLPIILSLFG